ncbi:WXG100 family type VII secretion target [Glycomyces salinus]|uniref:WXG100 family type VII secretion target n=1 Tax=Glycomyces salinus TaxID=980294 RepID=UPI0018EAECA6|nr:hypothetical protein [Glycomyces salinus]
MGSGKGFDFYRNNYTHEELWEMLSMGDSWSVEQASGVWRTARQDINTARDNLDTAMQELVGYWEGDASEEYQRRMRILRDYGDEASESMERAESDLLPRLSEFLGGAQSEARNQDLYPSSTLTEYADWLEATKPENLHYGQDKEVEQRSQLQQEHQSYLDDRHDKMARVVANLGDNYQQVAEEWKEPPPPPPSDMPGNTTYNPPTGGVFGNDGLNPGGAGGLGPGGATGANGAGFDSTNGSLAGADGIVGTDDDLEPVDGWTPGSYGDVDSGGLAAGTFSTAPTGGFGGSTVPTGGAGPMTSAGAGLFGPATTGGGGTTGRGTTPTSSPARSGASTNSRGTGSSGRGGPNTGGRPGSSTRGLNGRNNMGGRGGTRSGYSDDDEEEEYSRETWLREDDVNWGRNHTPDDELDD